MDTTILPSGATGYRHHPHHHHSQQTQQSQQQQPHKQAQVNRQVAANDSKRKKIEIPREKLTDYEFDKIVVETSANLAIREVQPHSYVSAEDSGHVKGCFQQQATTPLQSQPKRPMNAFMVWGQAIRRELHNRFSNVQNALLSKALGRVWKKLDFVEKEPYICRANIIKTNHKRDYPDYRYQPRRIQEKQRRIQKQHQPLAPTNNQPASQSLPLRAAPAKLVRSLNSSAHSGPDGRQLYHHHQSLQSLAPPFQLVIDSPDITQTASGNFGDIVGTAATPCNYQDNLNNGTTINDRSAIYKTSSHQYMLDSIQQNNTSNLNTNNLNTNNNNNSSSNNNSSNNISSSSCGNSNHAYGPASSAPALIKEVNGYSIYDESTSHCHSSEASGNDRSYLAKNLNQSLIYHNNDGQQHAKSFLDTSGQQTNYDRPLQVVYSARSLHTDHVHHQGGHNNHQLTEHNNNTSHYPATPIADVVSPCEANPMNYQCYRQQEHHQHQQDHHQQSRADIEDSVQYHCCAEQELYFDSAPRFNNDRMHDRPQMITQQPSLSNYDNVYRQVNRENYQTVCRTYPDELCLV